MEEILSDEFLSPPASPMSLADLMQKFWNYPVTQT
jgi:hypothetical protein